MPTSLKDRSDEDQQSRLSHAHDPTDEAFANIVANYDKTADTSPYDPVNRFGNLRKAENSTPANNPLNTESLNAKEKEGSTVNDAAAAVASQINPAVGAAAKALGFFRTKKGGGVAGGIIAIVLTVFGLSSLTPAGILLNLKENGTRWSNKYHAIGMKARDRQHKVSRYFQNPDDCKRIAVVCRYRAGVSEKEMARLRTAGFDLETANTSKGKVYLKSMSFTDADGVIKKADMGNFAELNKTSPHFSSLMNRVSSIGAMMFRGKNALNKMFSLGISRNKPLGEETIKEKIVRKLRERFYGSSLSGNLKVNSNGEADADGDSEADRAKLASVNAGDETVATEAEKIRSGLIENGPPPDLVTDISGLDTTTDISNYAKVAGSTIRGTVKGALMPFVGAVDSYCTFYRMLRLTSYSAKALAAASLIKYAALFLVVADQLKTGDIKPAQVALIADILLTPSHQKATKGFDFSNSEGFKLMSYGKVARPNGLSRFSVGTTTSKILSFVQEKMNFKGVSAQTCKKVKSWWGQAGLAIGGIAICIGTLGAGCVEGALQGVIQGALIGLVTQILTPRLISMAAGATTPDPLTDPEGGYGAGNAIGAGMMAFGGQIAGANGMPPLSKQDFALLQKETMTDQRTLAETYAIEDKAAGVFNPANPMSLTNQMAVAVGPSLSGVRTLSDAAVSIGSLINKGLAVIPRTISPAASAADLSDEYGGKYCVDEDVNNLQLAHDANCNIIHGPFPDTLESEQYTPEAVAEYLANAGHVDKDTGEIISDQFKEFKSVCSDTMAVYTTDGFGIDLEQGGTDTKQCLERDTLHKAFWLYIEDEALLSGQRDTNEGTLGVDSGIATNTGGALPNNSGTTGGSLVTGESKALAAKILASGNISGDSRYMGQLQDYARGDYTCNIDPLVLQVLATIVLPVSDGGLGHTIQISSLNRRCTGVLTGSGVASYHWAEKGGHAVDINWVDGTHATGATDADLALLNGLIPKLPMPTAPGSLPYEFGQINCRTGARALSTPAYINQVNDSCNHNHIGVTH